MLEYWVLQDRWLILGFFGGLAMIVFVTLVYFAIWRPREEERVDFHITGLKSLFAWLIWFMPWILVLTYICTISFIIIYLVARHFNPPNW